MDFQTTALPDRKPLFSHLHTHSHYSLLESLLSPLALAQAAAQVAMPALALTDHNNLTGAVEFYDACKKEGVKPILGLELDLALPPELSVIAESSGKLVLLAMDLEGWSNLCRLSSAIYSDPLLGETRLGTMALIAAHSTGLLCLTGGRRSLLSYLVGSGNQRAAGDLLGYLSEIYPNRLYVELQRTRADNENLMVNAFRLAKRHNLPVVATHDVYYRSQEEAEKGRLLAAIRRNQPMRDVPVEAYPDPDSLFTTPAEMEERFAAIPQALAITNEIIERCQLELPLGVPQYPLLSLQEGVSPIEVLRGKADQGARRLYGQVTPEIPGVK